MFEGSEFGSGSLAGNKDFGAFMLVLALILTRICSYSLTQQFPA
jgi:hypothetical protein